MFSEIAFVSTVWRAEGDTEKSFYWYRLLRDNEHTFEKSSFGFDFWQNISASLLLPHTKKGTGKAAELQKFSERPSAA